MRIRRSLQMLLTVCGVCAIFAGTAMASDAVDLFVNGQSLSPDDEARLDDGKVVAPARALAEAMGGRVKWDQETHSVNIQTAIAKDEVSEWIQEQGQESDYYFDGLFVEEVNVDRDHEPEVLARIDGGVHLGDFFIFDKGANGSYRLIFEQPWHVESWHLKSFRADGMNPLYEIVTRTGGTDVDIREAHLMYMSDAGVWLEAWNGTLKDRSVFQDNYYIIIGSYQFNDDNGQLFYWQTEMDASIEDNQQVCDSRTTTMVFELQQGRFVAKE